MITQRILYWLGPAHIVAGLLLALTVFVPDAQVLIARMSNLPANHPHTPFLLAVIGPTVASWGVLFTAIVTVFLEHPSPALWRAMVWSIAVWAPLDTALCLWFKAYGAAAMNGLVLILFVILLLNVRPLAYPNERLRDDV